MVHETEAGCACFLFLSGNVVFLYLLETNNITEWVHLAGPLFNSLFVKDFSNKIATALLVHFSLMFALVGWGGWRLLWLVILRGVRFAEMVKRCLFLSLLGSFVGAGGSLWNWIVSVGIGKTECKAFWQDLGSAYAGE